MFNVRYEGPNGSRHYCSEPCDLDTAKRMLKSFKTKYFNEDGAPKAYPNGKGFYPFRNPRIVRVK
jgi:hypothetical protein